MVGIRASCQPIPVLMIVALARLDRAGEPHDLLQRGAARHQVQHRQPVDQDEVRADPLTDPAHDLDREPDAVLVRAAPAVGAVIGGCGDELVDEVALGAHDLDPVVPGTACESGRPDEVLDGLLDLVVGEGVRGEGADRRLDRARCHQIGVVRVAAEMQDLHGDPAARRVDGRGDPCVLLGLGLGGHLGTAGQGAGAGVGGDAAGDHQADAAPGALRVEGGHPLEAVLDLFETYVHRAHQHTVGKRGEAQVERAQQMRVRAHAAAPRAVSVAPVVDHRNAIVQQVA